MLQVNVLEAKTDFSKLIRILETRKEDYITVARNGKPIIKMTLINETPVANRIGIAKGKFTMKGDFDADGHTLTEFEVGDILAGNGDEHHLLQHSFCVGGNAEAQPASR